MKKLIFLTMLYVSTNVVAQKGDLKLLIVGGGNFSFAVGPDVKNAKNVPNPYVNNTDISNYSASNKFTPRIGFHFGALVNYHLANKFSLKSGVIFSERGYRRKYEESYESKVYSNQILYKMTTKRENSDKVNLNYLDIPLTANLYLGNSFYIGAGPQFCFLFSSKNTYENSSDVISTVPNNGMVNSPPNTSTGSVLGAKPFLLGLQFGIGTTGKNIGFNLNVSKTGKPLDINGTLWGAPNLTIQAGLTYSISLKKSK